MEPLRRTPSLELFTGRIADHVSRNFVPLPAEATAADVVRAMRESHVEHVLLVGPDRRLVGMLSAGDVVREVAFIRDPSTPAVQVMGTPGPTIRQTEPLYRGLALLESSALGALAVIDAAGAPAGVLTREALGHHLLREAAPLAREVSRASGPADLKAARQAQWRLADWLHRRCGVPAPPVLSLLSTLNDRVYRTVLIACERDMIDQGWGEPPVRFAAIVMGSGGRGESLLRPDQDNGFILDDHPDSRRRAVDRYFHELADRMTRALDDAGLPLCNGYVMATNPSWRKQLSEWQAQILGWLKKPSIAATTLTDICIDFRHVHGDPALVEKLRAFTHKEIPRHHGFLRELEALQFDHDVAITPFRTLKRERLPGQTGDRQVDVKRKGIMPLVEGTRILALAHGVAGTATLERLDGLAAGGHIDSTLAEQVRYGFEFLTGLLLRAQISAMRMGHIPGAYVAPESLASPESEQLRAALKTAATLRGKVHGDFTAELF